MAHVPESKFRADCSQCSGLCCIVPDQLTVQGFGFDKPADTPCRHLDASGQCGIYETRAEQNFPACATFDCYGAGQWVTQQLFGGQPWQTDSPTAQEMSAAYRYWLPRFEAAALIESALPHVRDEARAGLAEFMTQLMTPDRTDINAAEIRPQALRLIRAGLKSTL